MEAFKVTLITLGIIAGILLLTISMYALIIIGLPIGIWYLVYIVRGVNNDNSTI